MSSKILLNQIKNISFLLLCLRILLNVSYAQNFNNGFNFSLPGSDTTSGNFLPAFPIKVIKDFVTINSDGHFSVNGKPIRFWGVNLVADGAFPEKSNAALIAGRLRKMGFNLIRFHHLDNSWSTGSLFEQGKDTRHLNPVTLDKLDYILYQLKRNGIYANINLNVSRGFNSKDGVPDSDSLQFNAMGVKVFDPQLIMLQKEFAKQLLTHVNLYTGLSLANDPLMAMLEITNENALYKGWQYGGAKHFSEGGLITWRHKVMLDTMFNSFLKKKYSTSVNLAHSWNTGANDTAGIKGLLDGESLEMKTVKRIDYDQCIFYTDARVKDMSEFYIKLQNDYFDGMLSYLKNELHVKVPIEGTNWNAGPGDLISQSRADYMDNHAYWQHPVFPGVPWSLTDWYIHNLPLVKASDNGTIPDLFAGAAMANKPYTISEYDHPFPNRYQTEMTIFTTAYLSFQDADGIMFYDYNSSPTGWDSDKVDGFFDISGNHSIISLMPSCAFAFRNNKISKAKNMIKINYTVDKIYILPKEQENPGVQISLFPKKLALSHSIRVESFTSDTLTNFSSLPPEPVNPYITDTKEINWNTNGLITINAPGFIGASGIANDFIDTKIGHLQLKEADGFCTFSWLSLDNDTLTHAKRSLFTLSSSIQNTGMIWDGITTVHDNWGTAPTEIKPVRLKLDLDLPADSVRVYPIDKFGNNNPEKFITYYPVNNNKFEILFDQNSDKTLWYGIEQFGVKTSLHDRAESKENHYRLEQNYPNPFNPETTISYQLAVISNVELKVYNMLGQEVAALVNEKQNPGTYEIKFNGNKLSSGIYMYRLSTGSFIQSKKMVLLK